MTHQQLKQGTIEIRKQLEQEIESQIRLLDPLASTDACQAFQHDYPLAAKELLEALGDHTEEKFNALTKEIAYTWFNRLCALRYMDLLHYTPIQVVSSSANTHLPEILWETKQGILPDVYVQSSSAAQKIQALLRGDTESSDPDTDMYTLLLQEACHYFQASMPFLFHSQQSLTYHIPPANLLDAHSVLYKIQNLLTEETVLHSLQENTSSHTPASGMVEIIGWLYQYYQTEDHTAIYEAFKKNYKAMAPDLPAATQLYTPEWIVRYMVDNSLGRLWLQYKPHSSIREKLQYYIEPEEPEAEILQITSPEDISFCDPACGSGHILTYAFDVLFAMYEEEGYTPSAIPATILQKNLWGMDIDKRACQLASFALVMKARAKDKRFFSRPVTQTIHNATQPIVETPHIRHLHCIRFTQEELEEALQDWNPSFDKDSLLQDILLLVQAAGVGSLLQPTSTAKEVQELHQYLQTKANSPTLSLSLQHLLPTLQEATATLLYLSQQYAIVCTNPPYLGTGKLTNNLKKYIAKEYKEGKSDLCTCFMLRNFQFLQPLGYNAMVTMQSWMFLSSFEELRKQITKEKTILNLVQMTNGVMRIAFGTCAFVIKNSSNSQLKGNYSYVQLEDIRKPNDQENKLFDHPYTFPIPNSRLATASSSDFHKIPGSPIAFWVSEKERIQYTKNKLLGNICQPKKGIDTGDNNRFLRLWFEVSIRRVGFRISCQNEAIQSLCKWFPYNKGGGFRKWYGNQEYVVNWDNGGYDLKKMVKSKTKKSTLRNKHFFFKEGFTWTTVSSSSFSSRYSPKGFIFDNGGCTLFSDKYLFKIASFVNSNLALRYLGFLSPTLNYQPGNISNLLFLDFVAPDNAHLSTKCTDISNSDWDAYERSWNFTRLPLLLPEYRTSSVEESYELVRKHWHEMTCEMHQLEVQNNTLFNKAYDLEDEISSEVLMQEITLTCNPAYRYPDKQGSKRSIEEKEELLKQDTMKELLSYYVGCLFGRYSLDKPGLVLANQGDTLATYEEQVELPSFLPDANNVVPILDDYWFNDDIVTRFQSFVKTCFGEDTLTSNIQYIEQVLGKTIRQYFLKDFYTDHVKTYKKRPIYWLFSSSKGAFQALIYMHRYTKDTPSIVLRYVRDYISKLRNKEQILQAKEIDHILTGKEQNKARKEREKLVKVIKELEDYEKNTLLPLATQRIEIDLDDGVKHNYPLFGKALKKVTGLSK